MAEVIKMPRLSDTMTDGVVAKWHKKVGDLVSEGDLLADIETDKATMEFESFQEGVLLHIGVLENETAEVDSILAILGEQGEDITQFLNNDFSSELDSKVVETKEPEKKPIIDSIGESSVIDESSLESNNQTFIKISPLARKMAKDKGIDLNILKGSGDGGRIIKRDIDSHRKSPSSNYGGLIKDQDIPISQMRKTIANRLSASKFSAPHFYLNIEVFMDELIKTRNDVNSHSEIKISFNDIIVKAVSMSLKKHPNINSSWMETIIKKHGDINVGIAVSIDGGLVVPVIKNADQKSFAQISLESKEYVEKAKSNKLQPSDWESNTFTISNLGMFGIDDFTAIINSPDSCILAVGAIKEQPIVKNGSVLVGNVMRLTLSCDHRVVDGVAGAQFLQTLKKMLETPVMIFC